MLKLDGVAVDADIKYNPEKAAHRIMKISTFIFSIKARTGKAAMWCSNIKVGLKSTTISKSKTIEA